MCVMSMVTDYYREKWEPLVPQPYTNPFGGGAGGSLPNTWPGIGGYPQVPSAAEVEEFRKLLERAREYDKRNNEPACELQEKKDALLAIAKALGIEINFL